MVLLGVTRPRLVTCRALPSPTKTEKATHVPAKEVKFPGNSMTEEKVNSVDNMSNRVLIEGQFHTMASGPSRRGSGH